MRTIFLEILNLNYSIIVCCKGEKFHFISHQVKFRVEKDVSQFKKSGFTVDLRDPLYLTKCCAIEISSS